MFPHNPLGFQIFLLHAFAEKVLYRPEGTFLAPVWVERAPSTTLSKEQQAAEATSRQMYAQDTKAGYLPDKDHQLARIMARDCKGNPRCLSRKYQAQSVHERIVDAHQKSWDLNPLDVQPSRDANRAAGYVAWREGARAGSPKLEQFDSKARMDSNFKTRLQPSLEESKRWVKRHPMGGIYPPSDVDTNPMTRSVRRRRKGQTDRAGLMKNGADAKQEYEAARQKRIDERRLELGRQRGKTPVEISEQRVLNRVAFKRATGWDKAPRRTKR